MIYIADSGIKIHKPLCRYAAQGFARYEFASAGHARKWANKQKRALCAYCKPLEQEKGDGNATGTEQ